MIMNTFEKLLMNNFFRRWLHKTYEIQTLRQMSHLPKNKDILEIGCGYGHGSALVKKHFFPKKLVATELDQSMIDLAQKRHPDITFELADATKLQYKDNSFDAIVDFGTIHHIPNWRKCLEELKRVLRKGGELIIEEISLETFDNFVGKFLKVTTDHPYEEMFTYKEFIDYLKELGFTLTEKKYNFFGFKGFFIVAKH